MHEFSHVSVLQASVRPILVRLHMSYLAVIRRQPIRCGALDRSKSNSDLTRSFVRI